MSEVRFYHHTVGTAKDTLPKLLEKTLERERRALVKLPDEDDVDFWNEYLWAYNAERFLPHGTIKEPGSDEHPIFLTHLDENPNGADYLFLINGADRVDLGIFDMTALLFDGNDQNAVNSARSKWMALREERHQLTYWEQANSGNWKKKT